ncbi:unnamed protein product, partial [marine sediment metagenome]
MSAISVPSFPSPLESSTDTPAPSSICHQPTKFPPSYKDEFETLPDSYISVMFAWSTWGLGDNLVGYWNFDGDNVNSPLNTSYD